MPMKELTYGIIAVVCMLAIIVPLTVLVWCDILPIGKSTVLLVFSAVIFVEMVIKWYLLRKGVLEVAQE